MELGPDSESVGVSGKAYVHISRLHFGFGSRTILMPRQPGPLQMLQYHCASVCVVPWSHELKNTVHPCYCLYWFQIPAVPGSVYREKNRKGKIISCPLKCIWYFYFCFPDTTTFFWKQDRPTFRIWSLFCCDTLFLKLHDMITKDKSWVLKTWTSVYKPLCSRFLSEIRVAPSLHSLDLIFLWCNLWWYSTAKWVPHFDGRFESWIPIETSSGNRQLKSPD